MKTPSKAKVLVQILQWIVCFMYVETEGLVHFFTCAVTSVTYVPPLSERGQQFKSFGGD
jgi:hypothetical protein